MSAFLICGLLLAALAEGDTRPLGAPRPNIILIYCDDLGGLPDKAGQRVYRYRQAPVPEGRCILAGGFNPRSASFHFRVA